MSDRHAAVAPGSTSELAAQVRDLRRKIANAAAAGQRGYACALRDRLWLLQVRLAYARKVRRCPA